MFLVEVTGALETPGRGVVEARRRRGSSRFLAYPCRRPRCRRDAQPTSQAYRKTRTSAALRSRGERTGQPAWTTLGRGSRLQRYLSSAGRAQRKSQSAAGRIRKIYLAPACPHQLLLITRKKWSPFRDLTKKKKNHFPFLFKSPF